MFKNSQRKIVSKKKLKEKITTVDTHRYILHDGTDLKITNKSGVEVLVTVFPAVHHE